MIEPGSLLRNASKGAVTLAVVALAAWWFWPAVQTKFAGFLLGMVFSMINGWYFCLKAQQLADMAVQSTKRRGGLGFVVRTGLSLLAVAIAVDKPQFDVLFTIVGLLYFHVMLVALSVVAINKRN